MSAIFYKSYSQNSNDDIKRMVDSAITIKANKLIELSYKILNNDKSYLENIYLLDEHDHPYFFSSLSTKMKFKTINLFDAGTKKMLRKQSIRTWKILYTLKKNVLNISIINFTISYEKGIYHYANGGGLRVEFIFNCAEEQWQLVEPK